MNLELWLQVSGMIVYINLRVGLDLGFILTKIFGSY